MSRTVYQLRLDTRQFESQLSKIEFRVNRLEKRLKSMSIGGRGGAAASRVRGGGAFLGLGIGGLAITSAVAGVGLVTSRIVKLGVEAERSKLTLSKLFGSFKAAEVEFRETERFAAFSPFNFQQVLRQRIALGARGVSRENQLPLLEVLGNFSSVLGTETLPFLSKAVGDVLAKGQLQGQEIRQFAEAGLNARKLVADLRGVSVAEVEGTFVSAIEFMRALERGQSRGTAFFNAMKDASQTVEGRFETAKDLMDSALRTMGQDLLPTMADALDGVVKGLNILQQSDVRGLFSDLVDVGTAFTNLLNFGAGKEGEISGVKLFFDTIRISALESAKALDTILFLGKSTSNFFTNDFKAQEKLEKDFKDRGIERQNRIMKVMQNFGRLQAPTDPLTSNLGKKLNFEAFTQGSLSSRPGSGGSGLTGGVTGVSGVSGGTRSITINIENLIREQVINGTTSLGQTAEDIKISVERALQTVFAETRIAQ